MKLQKLALLLELLVGQLSGPSYSLSSSTGGNAQVSVDTRQRYLLPLQVVVIANKQPRNFWSNYCCQLLVPINVFRHLDVSFTKSKPLSKFQNCYAALRLRLFSPQLLRGSLASGFRKDGRAPASTSYYMYMNQQDAQNSCNQALFSIRCSTCFGLSGATL